MRKVLYLVRRPESLSSGLIPRQPPPDHEQTVLLLEEAVRLTEVPGSRVLALADDVAARQVASRFDTVTYRDMLELMFAADTVIAL